MRRLLLSVGMALLVGGFAVAANADQDFLDLPTVEIAARQPSTDPPLAASDLPLIGQPTPVQPSDDGATVKQTGTTTESACRPEELLVKFKPGADASIVAGRHGASVLSNIPQLGIYVLAVPPGAQAATLSALSADPDVEYAEPNGVVRVPELPPTADPCAPEATPSTP